MSKLKQQMAAARTTAAASSAGAPQTQDPESRVRGAVIAAQLRARRAAQLEQERLAVEADAAEGAKVGHILAPLLAPSLPQCVFVCSFYCFTSR